jgi:hypothetical protein
MLLGVMKALNMQLSASAATDKNGAKVQADALPRSNARWGARNPSATW